MQRPGDQWATSSPGQVSPATTSPFSGRSLPSFSVTKTPEPESALASYKSSLNQVAGQLASDAGATIVSQTDPIPILDVAVKDVVYQKGGSVWHARIELLKDRLYTIISKSPGPDEDLFNHFVNTFQILGPR